MDNRETATDETKTTLGAGDPPASATPAPPPAATAPEAVGDTEPAGDGENAAPAPPATNEQGFAMLGDYPLNIRLRAEAMANDGVETDPGGVVSDELIAETKDRLAAEKADEVKTTPSLKWRRDELAAEAVRVGAAFETDANKETILAAIRAKTEA